ncbi:MAG: hypothetical protein FWD61_18455 [Phycisphaerales bacterium]|nr:hypothetical protein [Phycisphaerales bacterium]
MTAMTNQQFEEYVMKLAESAPPFEPFAYYNTDGDCIEFFAKSDMYYGERIDDLITVYYSQETNEIVGSLIKGIKRLCRKLSEKMPAFQIEIQDGPVKLVHLLYFAKLLASPDNQPENVPTLTYRKQVYDRLIEAAARTDAKAELACV